MKEQAPETMRDASSYEKEIAQLIAERDEFKQKFLYLSADFETVRRRLDDVRTQAVLKAQARILRDILAIVDDFERTFEAAKNNHNATAHAAGFEFIYKALLKFLREHGVQEITETTVFNPELHEAIEQKSESGKKAGEILHIIHKGYTFHGIILRPAQVIVAQ